MKAEPKAKPSDYKHIRAWGLMMGSYEYYISNEQARAAEDEAPLNVIYQEHGTDRWVTFDECKSETTKLHVEAILASMK